MGVMEEVSASEFQTNLDTLIQEANSAVERMDDGGKRYPRDSDDSRILSNGENSIFTNDYLLPEDTEYHKLSLSTLQRVPVYLCDALLKPEGTIATTYDHLQYWGWTSAVIAANSEIQDENTQDIQLSTHLGQSPIRIDWRENPTLEAITFRRDRMMLLAGFASLEGRICRYTDILTETGDVTGEIVASWKPDKVDENKKRITPGDQPTYSDLLQIWRKTSNSNITTDTLNEINNMSRYDTETLFWKFPEMEEIIREDLEDGTYNFLRLIGEYRKENYHGHKATATVAPIVLTLCCLTVWENIEEDDFEAATEEAVKRIESRHTTPFTQSESLHPFWPSSFYPIDSGE